MCSSSYNFLIKKKLTFLFSHLSSSSSYLHRSSVNREFGIALLGSAAHNQTASNATLVIYQSNPLVHVQYGSGILLATILFGTTTSAWLSFAWRWYLRNEDVSAKLVLLMTLDVVILIAALGGTTLASLVYEQLGISLGPNLQGWFGVLALEGLLLMCGGFLSRLERFVQDASNFVLFVCGVAYFVCFAMPLPLLLPFDVLFDLQSGDWYPVFATILVVGLFLGAWCIALYTSVSEKRHELLIFVGDCVVDKEEEKAEEEEEAAYQEQRRREKDEQDAREEEERERGLPQRKTSFLGNRLLSDAEEEMLQEEGSEKTERSDLQEEKTRSTEDKDEKETDETEKKMSRVIASHQHEVAEFVRRRERDRVLNNPKKFLHRGVLRHFQRMWILPTFLYVVLVCPSVPTLVILQLSDSFSRSFGDDRTFLHCLATAGVLLLVWLWWHGPLSELHQNFGTNEHLCRPAPVLENARIEIAKCLMFLLCVYTPSIALVAGAYEFTSSRIPCIVLVVVGIGSIFWTETIWSKRFLYWGSEHSRALFSFLWLFMIMVPITVLLPHLIERIITSSFDLGGLQSGRCDDVPGRSYVVSVNTTEGMGEREKCVTMALEVGRRNIMSRDAEYQNVPPGCFVDPSGNVVFNKRNNSLVLCSQTFACLCEGGGKIGNPYLSDTVEIFFLVVLTLGFLWTPYLFFHQSRRLHLERWYQVRCPLF